VLHGQPTPKTPHPANQSHWAATRLWDRSVGWRSRPQSGLGCSSRTYWRDHPLELPNGHFIKLGTGLESEERDIITPILVGNTNLFAWSTPDLPGVDPQVTSHKLSIYKKAQYISPKKRKLGKERRLAAKAEADKLLSAGFIEEAHYTTWISNVVLVKKANDKWQMCVDYTDLNKACPRDAYPLPNIDRLIGRLTTISRFLPTLVEQIQPIIQLLKKSAKFTWNDDCEQIFQKLKTTLTSPVILHKPDTHQPLLVYITTTDHTVNAVLVQDVGGNQHLVYFVRRTNEDPETRYQVVEKLALSLVHAARRLRPYFQNHNIIIKTDYPI